MSLRHSIATSPLFPAIFGGFLFGAYQIGIELNDYLFEHLTIQTGVTYTMMQSRMGDPFSRYCVIERHVYFFGLWEYRLDQSLDVHSQWLTTSLWMTQKAFVFILCTFIGYLIAKGVAKQLTAVQTH